METTMMEDQLEKKMENEMETREYIGIMGSIGIMFVSGGTRGLLAEGCQRLHLCWRAHDPAVKGLGFRVYGLVCRVMDETAFYDSVL